jgi:hypothetical protein
MSHKTPDYNTEVPNYDPVDSLRRQYYLLITGMTVRQTGFSPTLRSIAAGTLLVWIAALVFCAKICSSNGSASDSETSHCHAEAADSHHHHGDPPQPSHHGPCGSASCLTLKQALLSDKARLASYPALEPLYTLPVFGLTLDSTDAAFDESFRQPKPRDWVFTPEVCLGPAFRSLAPPSLPVA